MPAAHRHSEWLKFLRQIDRATPKDKTLHLIATTTPPQASTVQTWLAKHPRFHMHFTPTSASWLNMVERFFRDLTTSACAAACSPACPSWNRPSTRTSPHHNTHPKPFIWTKSARDILQKVIRANSRFSSKQNAAAHAATGARYP